MLQNKRELTLFVGGAMASTKTVLTELRMNSTLENLYSIFMSSATHKTLLSHVEKWNKMPLSKVKSYGI